MLRCLAEATAFDLAAWWIYGIGAVSGLVALYCIVLLIVRHEIRAHMRGLVLAGMAQPRNKRGQFTRRR